MMHRLLLLIINLMLPVGALLQADCPCCPQENKEATDIQHHGLCLHNPYFIANKGASNAAAYLSITNSADTDDELLSVSFFGKMIPHIELHTHVIDGKGIARMRPVERFVIVKNGNKALQPGGDHIMLMKVNEALADMQTINLTLHFKHAGKVTVTFQKKNLTVSCCGDR